MARYLWMGFTCIVDGAPITNEADAFTLKDSAGRSVAYACAKHGEAMSANVVHGESMSLVQFVTENDGIVFSVRL